MGEIRSIPDPLLRKGAFSRREYVEAMVSAHGITEPQAAYDLSRHLRAGHGARKNMEKKT